MYVCMYVCLFVCMNTYMHMYMYVYMYYVYVSANVCTHAKKVRDSSLQDLRMVPT